MQNNHHSYGYLIMFDGPDGVGKTTQIELAAQALRQHGIAVYVTRAHGGTPFGEALRQVSLSSIARTPLADLLLSRTIHAELIDDIQKRRLAGITCLVDRSPAAMWAYQVCGSGLDAQIADPIIRDDFTQCGASLLIIYHADLAVLKRHIDRLSDSKSDYFEQKADSYHERVINGYAEAVKRYDGNRIDAIGTIESVHTETMAIIRNYMDSDNSAQA